MTLRSTVNTMFVAATTAALETERQKQETNYVRKTKLADDRAALMAELAEGKVGDDEALSRLMALDATERAVDQLIAAQDQRVAIAQEAEDARIHAKQREEQRQIANTKLKSFQQGNGEVRRQMLKLPQLLAAAHEAMTVAFEQSNRVRKLVNPFDAGDDDAATTAAITREELRHLFRQACLVAGFGEFLSIAGFDEVCPLADELGDLIENRTERFKQELGLIASPTPEPIPEPEPIDYEGNAARAEAELARMASQAGRAPLAPGELRFVDDANGGQPASPPILNAYAVYRTNPWPHMTTPLRLTGMLR